MTLVPASPEPVGPEALPPPAPPWLTAAVSGVLAAAIFLAPELLKLLAPVPLLIAGRRGGVGLAIRAAVIGAVLAPVLAGVLAVAGFGSGGAGTGLQFVVLVGVPAVLLDRCLAWTKDARRALEIASTSYIVTGFVVVGLAGLAVPGGAGRLVADQVASAFDAHVVALEAKAGQDARMEERLRAFQQERDAWQMRSIRLFHALTVSLLIVGFWLNVMYARWFVGGENEDDDLTRWRLGPAVLPLTMAVMTGVVLQKGPIGDLVPRIDALYWGALAGLVLLGVLYTLQGVAVVNWWFVRLRVSPLLRMVGIGAQAVFLMSPTAVVFTAVGLADAWFDLRKLDEEAEAATGEER